MNCPVRRRACVCVGREKRHAQKAEDDHLHMSNPVDISAGAPECPICMGEFVAPCRTTCGHLFCTDCLQASFPAETPSGTSRCPLCRSTISLYTTEAIDTGIALKQPKPFYGHCVYLQAGKPGVASYHFDSPDDCYISYVNAPEAWRTDDGSPLPTKKQFANAAYDPLTRTFTGTITWSPTINNGDARWQYRMVFSESLNLILGGESKQFDADGTQRGTHSFPDELTYWRELRPAVRADSADASPYGLTFIQGGRIGLASYHFIHEGEGGSYISYEHAPEQWRLDDGSFPPARKHFKDPQYDSSTRTFTGQIEWAPTSFGGEARWEYTMIFSADMDAIVGGMVKAFKPDGSASRNHKFGTSTSSAFGALSRLFGDNVLVYERHDEAKAEMFSLLLARQNSRGAAAGANNENEQEQQERA